MDPSRRKWDDDELDEKFDSIDQALKRRPTHDTVERRLSKATTGSWSRGQIAVAVITGGFAFASACVLAYVQYKTSVPIQIPAK